MSTEKRISQRNISGLPVDLVLYDSTDDSTLSGPNSSYLDNISYLGGGLILPEIFHAPYHFFYAPRDNEKQVLCLEKKRADETTRIIIPINPIWFRLGDGDIKGYYRMGVEFLAPPEDKDIIDLEKMALECFEVRETLLTKLIRIFH